MNFTIIEISEDHYSLLGRLMTKRFGIKLPPAKRVMFQARLQARLRDLQMTSFQHYIDHTLNPANTNAELEAMVSYISTNKTEFFREEQHFRLLTDEILPALLEKNEEGKNKCLYCWSAGCSKGQEAFSLAMTIDRAIREFSPSLDFYILGTDVSSRVLEVARSGIYPFHESGQIPMPYLKEYLLKSKDKHQPKIKIVNTLRSKVHFRYGNLMDNDYRINEQFQIIFLRNTLIYFGSDDQTAILNKVLKYLVPGGYLFIGHSESLVNRGLPLNTIAPSVYQKITP